VINISLNYAVQNPLCLPRIKYGASSFTKADDGFSGISPPAAAPFVLLVKGGEEEDLAVAMGKIIPLSSFSRGDKGWGYLIADS
jgi:hypothetical protein